MQKRDEILLEKYGFIDTPFRKEKEELGQKIALNAKDGERIGFGSGSTSFLSALAIGKAKEEKHLSLEAVVTSKALEEVCNAYKIPVKPLGEGNLDWYFDGADEVDPERNLIKGRGGMLLKEKLVMKEAKKVFILVDQSKFVSYLGEKSPVPVEIVPMAKDVVSRALKKLGASQIKLREKDGLPFISENHNFILDAYFKNISNDLEEKINLIVGVLENGLFLNYPLEVISL